MFCFVLLFSVMLSRVPFFVSFSILVCMFVFFCFVLLFSLCFVVFCVSFVFVLFRPPLLSLQAGVYPMITVLKPLKGKVQVLNIGMICSLCTVREKI